MFESGNGWMKPALLVPINWKSFLCDMWKLFLWEKREVLAFPMCLVDFPGTAQLTKLSLTGLGLQR